MDPCLRGDRWAYCAALVSGKSSTTMNTAPVLKTTALEAFDIAAACSQAGGVVPPVPNIDFASVEAIPTGQLRQLFDAVVMGSHADVGLEFLRLSGLLEHFLPETVAMVGLGDGQGRHKDVWQHTKQVVIQSVKRPAVRWAALFHDIGKLPTRGNKGDGGVHFHGHAQVGARMFDRIVRRERWCLGDRALEKEVRFLIYHHQRTSFFDGSWTDSGVRRFAKDMGPYLDNTFALARADLTTKRRERKRRILHQLKDLHDRVIQLAEEDAKVPPLPKGLGSEIMKAFDLPHLG